MDEVNTHMWATVPDESRRCRLAINIHHDFGDLPERVQVEAFDAARAVVEHYGATLGRVS